jgi:hypothetical protein
MSFVSLFERCVRCLVLPVSFVAMHATANAQQWVKDPVVRICENITSCDDEKHIDLSQEELAFVEALLKGIPAKSSEERVKRYFGKPALNNTEPVVLDLGKWQGKSHRATWRIDEAGNSAVYPHVDVYFFNDQAFMVKWWFNGMKKMVQLTYVK